MKVKPLDKYEEQLFKDIDAGKFVPLEGKEYEDMKDKLQKAAKNSLERKRSVTIRISEKDFLNYKVKASKLGIGHLTLMSSVLHQNASNIPFE